MRRGQVLVLNFDYSPITICTVQRAFILVFLKKADMVAALAGYSLRSVSATYSAPAVIRLNRYVHAPYKGVMLTRQNIFKRDGHQCQYCGSSRELTLDDVIPRARNGKSTWTNLVTACKRCNTHKGDFSLERSGLNLKRQPVKPSYLDFLCNSSGFMQEEWKPFLKLKKAS